MKALSLLKATRREEVGKSKARLLRRQGMIPAVVYGKGKDSISLSLESIYLDQILRVSKTSQFLLDLIIDGKTKKVTIKDLAKHPVSGKVLHVDFYEVAMNRKIKVKVPINTIGICKGVELGGMLQIIRREVEVLCLPNNIPDALAVDITELDIGDSFHLMDLVLANGIDIYGESNYTILTILNQKSMEAEDTVEEDTEKVDLAAKDE